VGDHFEQALEAIARRRNGGGKTPDDIFDLAVASNRDAEERHEQSVQLYQQLAEEVKTHLVEASVRDERLEALEGWRHEASTTCEDRVVALIEREHEQRQDRLVWFFASTAGKLVLVGLGVAISVGVHVLLTGTP
jgi:hypothetical protein